MRIKGVVWLIMVIASIGFCIEANAYNYNNLNDRYTNNPYFATSSRYDYMYANPPKQSLGAYGRYIFSSGGTRYVHSPSRLKGAKHAARINAYNRYAMGY